MDVGKPLSVRVRFAPSPTGYLHVGGARTALYNWLFAKANKGTFILRIEDTDVERSKTFYLSEILNDLKWLGLEWDEGPGVGGELGPYYQSDRGKIYSKYIKKLLTGGFAYYCFCTQEDLNNRQNFGFGYDGHCRNLTQNDVKQRIEANIPATIRFKVPSEGIVEFKDIINKRIRVDNRHLDDFIIVRSDNTPTYNLASVVDDLTMKISHVIRGDDHISNTPKQILIYKALGEFPPQYAHIPMILGSDGARLSKRHGACAVDVYREMGYLPQSMINYLALLGWSYNDKQTLFELEELIDKFTLDRINKNASIFDEKKLAWMNGVYIRKFNPDQLYSCSIHYLNEGGFCYKADKNEITFNGKKIDKDYLKKLLSLIASRIKRMDQVVDLISYFFNDNIEYTKEAELKLIDDNDLVLKIFSSLQKKLSLVKYFDLVSLENACNMILDEMGIKLGQLVHPVRAAITGRTMSPGLFETMELLGRERVLLRIKKALEYIQYAAGSANGRPGDSGSSSPGSNPGPAANNNG